MNSSLVALVEQVDGLFDAVTDDATVNTGDDRGTDRTSELSDDQLRQVLVGLEQIVNRAQAIQGQIMVQMGSRARDADRAEVVVGGEPMWSQQCRETYVPDEIGVLLGWTKMAAVTRYETACCAADLPVVAKAWLAGSVDARKVAVIGEEVGCLDRATAQALASEAVGYVTAPDRCRTAPQLRQWLRRKVIEINPDAAEQRRQRANGDRRVVITAGEDGMCELWALLPGVQGRQIQQALTTAAQHMGADDARTMDQRRADTLVDLLLGRAEPAEVSLQVIVGADTLAGSSQEPGWVPGLGPVTATEVQELVGPGLGADTRAGAGLGARVSVRRLLTDPVTGTLTDLAEKRYRPSAVLDRAVRARDVTCRFPGCRRPADSAGTDLDHTTPWPQGPTSAANLAVLCRRHHRLKHTPGWNAELDPSGVMTWTTPTGRQITTHPWQYTNPHPPPRE